MDRRTEASRTGELKHCDWLLWKVFLRARIYACISSRASSSENAPESLVGSGFSHAVTQSGGVVGAGPFGEMFFCHCGDCRRWHGSLCAGSVVQRHQLDVSPDASLNWFKNPTSERHASRAFCATCGSNLFWVPEEEHWCASPRGHLISPAA